MTESILKRLKTQPTPIIDNNTATFVWKGKTPPVLVGDFTGWDDENPVMMVKSEPGVWTYQFIFLPDSYIEYGFRKGEESIPDPFNPRQTPNGIGGYNNYFFMPEYNPTTLARKKRNIPHGMITTYNLPTDYVISGRKRAVHLYQPPVTDPVPLIVVWDGQDYLYRIHLNYLVDNLISQKRIRPLALAFIDNGGQELRTVEYACNDATLAFLMTEVIPLAKKELNLIDITKSPGTFGTLGASMGGLIALYTSVRIPHVFGNVLSQSGAFSWRNFDMVVFDLLQLGEVRPIKIWMDVGFYDLAGLLDTNRRMQSLLNLRGYPITYREYHAGHNYPSWRDDIWRGLETLYGAENTEP
jgi:enterochelin esterase family protein